MKREWYIKGHELVSDIANTAVSADEAGIWYIGQCGFVVKRQSVMYIDPVLNDIVDESGNTQRLYEAPCVPSEVYADYVLCTHAHIDHMAEKTVKGLYMNNRNVKFIVPEVCKDILLTWGIREEQVIEAVSGETILLPDIKIIPVSTAHPAHFVSEDGKERSLAYHITLGRITLLHMGDTYLTSRLVTDLKKLPQPDVLMVPINGKNFFLEQKDMIGNMTAREAAMLADVLCADLTIPMHYDMIKGNTVNPVHFIEELWQINSGRKISLPALGERILYKKRTMTERESR